MKKNLSIEIGDEAYLQLKKEVIQATGLVYFLSRDTELLDKISERMKQLQLPDCQRYLHYIHTQGTNGRDEFDRLIALLTIGETYFFRGADQFEALREQIIPELIQWRGSEKKLRIWSAGCSTGAEAYSLAILLDQYFSALLRDWEINILGTDINRRFLEKGLEGLFDEWDFRGTTPDLRETYFKKEGKRWRIHPRIKNQVSFQYHNLLQSPFPAIMGCLEAMDLVICRNVTIYFDAPTTTRVLHHFQEALRPGGWLLLGHAEHVGSIPEMDAVAVHHLIFHQKKSKVCVPTIAADPVASLNSPVTVPADISPSFDIDRVRLAADQGNFAEATLYCQNFLKKDDLNAVGHFYYGLILDQMGRLDESVDQLERSLKIDSSFALSYHYLGMIYLKKKRIDRARYWFLRGQEVLVSIPKHTVFEYADGLTASELYKMIQLNLKMTENLGERT